jgi:hypothetical protein
MDVLIVGGDPAVQEGVLQSVRAAGLNAEGCPDVRCAREAVSESRPVALVLHADLGSAGEELRDLSPIPGGAVVLFRDADQGDASAGQPFGRSVIAELTLPLERARLIALLNHIVARARVTGHDKRPPEPPLSP